MDMASVGSPLLWVGFLLFVFAMLALDLGVFHRSAHAVGFREALGWSAAWISLAGVFALGVWFYFGAQPALEFTTGYLIEKALSIDNIFVFVVIFSALSIPSQFQHRVLFWGILSALVLRAGMIFAGAALLERFHFLIYVFGAFLIFTGVKLYVGRNKEERPEDGRFLRWVRRVVPSTDKLDGPHFFTRIDGRRLATPLFLALVLVELTDVVFALDSIPAIFAVTRDPFLIFTSNIFAILGLRSLFFVVAGMLHRFTYLKVGLAAVLVFVGTKMLVVDWIKVPPLVSLLVIVLLIGGSVAASTWRPKVKAPDDAPKPGAPVVEA
jgi:tellurite resistance protein TerC